MAEYIFPLTLKEGLDGNCKGYAYAMANRKRWVDITSKGKVDWHDTYDRAVTHFVHDNKVYHIHQDFILLDENSRLFIVEQSRNQANYADYKLPSN